MGQHFPKPYESSGGNVKVELDLSKYAKRQTLEEQQVLIHI